VVISSGQFNSDVSRVNIASVVHCGIDASSATIALGLTLSWFPTSAIGQILYVIIVSYDSFENCEIWMKIDEDIVK